jgi:nucleoside-diphosphate-sugar epimerase
MKALITGSSGFCGRHLTRYLVEQGVDVFTLGLRSGGKSHYQILSVDDVPGTLKALQDLKPGFVFHLAGTLGAENPASIYQVNAVYALALLRALDLAGLSNTAVLLAGSAAEYGFIPEEYLPVNEDFPCKPYSYYGISKLAQTLTGLLEARRSRPIVTVRAFNIVGPGMPDHLVVGALAKQVDQIVKGKREAVVEIGNRLTSRDFIDIEDVLPIYWKLIRTPAAHGEIVNVCTGEPTPVQTVLERMIALSGKEIQIVSRSERLRVLDPLVSYGSTERLERLIGYAPKLELEKSLRMILGHLAKET